MCNDLNQTLLEKLDPQVANKLIDSHVFQNTLESIVSAIIAGSIIYMFVKNT